MPIHQLDQKWPNRDHTNRDKPLGKRAPLPKRGDGLPRESKYSLAKGFLSHDLAVKYAVTFDDHVPVQVRWREDGYGIIRKVFVVDPDKGRRALIRKITSKVNA